MYQLKYLPTICGLIVLGIIINIIHELFGIPVTMVDVMLLPLAILISFVILRYEFFNKKHLLRYNLATPPSTAKKMGIFIVCLLLTVSGIWCLWLGIREPLAYYSGVRGAAHGYTLAAFGLSFLVMGAYGVLKTILIHFFKAPE